VSGIDFKKRIPAGILEKHADLRAPSQAQMLESSTWRSNRLDIE
jgi:hypothetical protein